MKYAITTLKITIFIVFGAIAALTVSAYLNLPLPVKPLVVMSGSMEPAIKTGSVVLVAEKPQTGGNYVPGDILTFKTGGSVVSHRVAQSLIENGENVYKTKGDANQATDQTIVSEKEVIGKVAFSVPYIGKFVNFVKQPLGFFLLIIIPTLMIIFSELLAMWDELRRRPVKNSNLDLVKPFSMFFMALIFLNTSHAFFTDVAVSSGNTFVAAESFDNGIADHIVISEVQIDGGTNVENDHDFIELYNPTNSPYNLNGHRLVKRTAGASPSDVELFNWTTDVFIQPYGFYLWASSDDSTYPNTIGADASKGVNLAGNNSIAIRQGSLNSGSIVDSLSWSSVTGSLGEGTRFSPDPQENQSMERKALSTSTQESMLTGDSLKGNGFDTDNNATDFILRAVSQPQNSSSPTESP